MFYESIIHSRRVDVHKNENPGRVFCEILSTKPSICGIIILILQLLIPGKAGVIDYRREETMIVLNVIYKCKPDMREEFYDMILAEGLGEASRAEAGNLKYDYYFPVDNSDEMLLVEKWKDAEALAEHGKQPHFARLGELKGTYVFDTIIEKFVVND